MNKSVKLQETLQIIYKGAVEAMSGVLDTRNMYIALYYEKENVIEFPLVRRQMGQAGHRDRSEVILSRSNVTNPKINASNQSYVSGTDDVCYIRWEPRRLGERDGLTEWIIRNKKPLLIRRDFDSWVQAQSEIKAYLGITKCWLGAPMMYGDKVIGVIGLQDYEREDVFDEQHKDLLMTIASQAAAGIENARLVERLVRAEREVADERQRRLKRLQKISEQLVSATLNPDDVLVLVAKAANEISHGDVTNIYLYNEVSGTFTSGVRVSENDGVKSNLSNLPSSSGFPAQRAKSQQPLFVNDVNSHPETTDYARRRRWGAFAALPLTVGNTQGTHSTVGLLFVNFIQSHKFPEEEQEVLTHLANQAAVAIAYASAQKSAQAKEQLAALGTAAGTLQHRLGNTINVILPAVMRLRFRVGGDPENEKILETIERNALFATEVIRRMQTPLRHEPFVQTEINSLLQDAIQKCIQDKDRFSKVTLITNLNGLAETEAASKDVRQPKINVIAHLDETLPRTFASIGQMTEVFRVLIENAIKAIYPDAGQVMITSRFTPERTRPCAEIIVTDTGRGMEETTKRRLFKQPVPRKEFGQGAGLGLWLSHIIVRSHQGSLELQSTKLREGTTFKVTLPILHQPLPGAVGIPGGEEK